MRSRPGFELLKEGKRPASHDWWIRAWCSTDDSCASHDACGARMCTASEAHGRAFRMHAPQPPSCWESESVRSYLCLLCAQIARNWRSKNT